MFWRVSTVLVLTSRPVAATSSRVRSTSSKLAGSVPAKAQWVEASAPCR